MIWIIVIIQAVAIVRLWAVVDYLIDCIDKLQQKIIDSNKQRIEALERR